jgi:hypothetical protein
MMMVLMLVQGLEIEVWLEEGLVDYIIPMLCTSLKTPALLLSSRRIIPHAVV